MTDAEQPPAQPVLPSPYEGSGHGGKRRGRGRRTHTVVKVVLATLLTLGMVSGLSVAFLYRHLNGNLNVVDVAPQLYNRPEKVHIPHAPHQPLNILVMGSDTRDGKGNDIDGLTGGGARSDTTIVVHLSADRKTAYGVSIPRDSMVQRPDCKAKDGDTIPGGFDMWNAAFSYGGAACTIEQFEQLTGVKIDDYLVVDFGGFKSMVDAIGGVQVCVPEDIDDDIGHIHIKAGTRTLNGSEALGYVRVRHGIGDGSDTSRIKRQQAFVAAMVSKAVSGGVLARPDRIVRFLDAATKSLTTDIKNIKDIARIGLQFQDIGLGKIKFVTVPYEAYAPDPNRLEWAPDAKALWSRVAHDKPLGKLASGSINAGNVPGVTPSGSPSASSPASSPASSSAPETQDSSGSGSPSPTPHPSSSSSSDPSQRDEELSQAGLCT